MIASFEFYPVYKHTRMHQEFSVDTGVVYYNRSARSSGMQTKGEVT